jgi:hypothetical protein
VAEGDNPFSKYASSPASPVDSENPFQKYARSPAAPEKTYVNDAGQPFTLSGKPAPQQKSDSGYTGSILPFRRDESGLNLAVPEAIMSPIRGAVSGGKRAWGTGERGQDPLRPLSPDEMAAASFGATPAPGTHGALGQVLLRDDPEAAAKLITKSYNSGIKPGRTMTAPQRDVYEGNVRTAVGAIVDNVGRGPLPKTPEDFSRSIATTKSAVYDKYSGMAREAEQGGVRVSLAPAATRLRQLAADKMQDPAAAAEAKRLLGLIPGTGGAITPTRAEEIMRFLNERATQFDTQGSKGGGAVFREAGNALRGALVEAMGKAGYADYGRLRQTYGALVAIEDDVGRATGRALSGGGPTIGLSEIGAAGLAGAGEPLSAATVQGAKWYSRWLKSPNRAITRLFQEAAAPETRPGGVPVAAGLGQAAGLAGAAGDATGGSDDELTRGLGLLMFGKGQQPVSPP